MIGAANAHFMLHIFHVYGRNAIHDSLFPPQPAVTHSLVLLALALNEDGNQVPPLRDGGLLRDTKQHRLPSKGPGVGSNFATNPFFQASVFDPVSFTDLSDPTSYLSHRVALPRCVADRVFWGIGSSHERCRLLGVLGLNLR